MAQVVTCGELLIDFVASEADVTLSEAPAFHKAAGGAPANVAVGLARLGVACAFLGMVGADPFGHFLAQTLSANGVDVQGLRFTTAAPTALAFVALRSDGERDFWFYGQPSADRLYQPADVDSGLIAAAQIFHCGSISLISEPARSATLHALSVAQQHNLLISYDPNLRLALWPSAEAARTAILEVWSLAQVIKVSAEELKFLTGQADVSAAGRQLWHRGLKLLLVTRGRAGCTYLTAHAEGNIPGFAVEALDATGAGDSFMAAMLAEIIAFPNLWTNQTLLEHSLRFANAAGALTTTSHGAIPALPSRDAVEQWLSSHSPRDSAG